MYYIHTSVCVLLARTRILGVYTSRDFSITHTDTNKQTGRQTRRHAHNGTPFFRVHSSPSWLSLSFLHVCKSSVDWSTLWRDT